MNYPWRHAFVEILNEQVLLQDPFLVNIPSGAVEEIEIEGNLDEAHTGVNQPARQQTALAELAAVQFPYRAGFLVEVEDVHETRPRHAEALLVDVDLRLNGRISRATGLVVLTQDAHVRQALA